MQPRYQRPAATETGPIQIHAFGAQVFRVVVVSSIVLHRALLGGWIAACN